MSNEQNPVDHGRHDSWKIKERPVTDSQLKPETGDVVLFRRELEITGELKPEAPIDGEHQVADSGMEATPKAEMPQRGPNSREHRRWKDATKTDRNYFVKFD